MTNRTPPTWSHCAERGDGGLRLDLFLRRRGGAPSRIRARDLLAAGSVYVNGRRVKIASRPIRCGDRIEIYGPRGGNRPRVPPGVDPFRVVHEDAAVLVVDKAAGILVQSTLQGDRDTLLDRLRRHLRRRHPEGKPGYLGLLHRIDRDTSGLLLFSRQGSANRILADQFRRHSLTREYLALVHGVPDRDFGTVTRRIYRPAPGRRRHARGDSDRGLAAVTHYRVRERFAGAALLVVTLETGRTHQIRIHLASEGHPVVGDRVYGRPPSSPGPEILRRFPRQALHAARLGFTHPTTGNWLEFESPLPADLAVLLSTLRGEPEAPPAPA